MSCSDAVLAAEVSGFFGGFTYWFLLLTMLLLPPLYVMKLFQISSLNPGASILNKQPFIVPCLYLASV